MVINLFGKLKNNSYICTMKEYKIKITFLDGSSDEISISTDRLVWSMAQYQRNREPFSWEIVE